MSKSFFSRRRTLPVMASETDKWQKIGRAAQIRAD